MAIGSPPITWDLKHTGELWVYIGTPLPNPSGNTGVMVCMYVYKVLVTLFLLFLFVKTMWLMTNRKQLASDRGFA